MAKMSYLEVVGLLSDKLTGPEKKRLDHVIARKTALKEEDADLDAVLDGLLRELQGTQADD
jgi:hypothetical protein